MQKPPPPSQQQAEEAQRARHAAELSVLSLFASTGRGGGGVKGESSTIEAVKLSAILAILSAAVVGASFRHPRDPSRHLLVSNPDNDKIAKAVLPEAQRVFDGLKTSKLPDDQRAVLWATWAYSEVSNKVANTVNESGLALPEFLGATLRKVWISRSDRRVRPLHARLHGKTVPVTGDFWRWPQTGQRLRWPGDAEAPMDATIGCRCVSLLTWAKQDEVSSTIQRIVEHTEAEE